MSDAGDSESWLESAHRYAELAAHQIARLRNPAWNPTWQDLVPNRGFTIRWGLRGRRSRPAAVESAKGAADPATCSPSTPFDFGSGSGSGSGYDASTSGSDDASSSLETATVKRLRVGDGADDSDLGGRCETKMAGMEQGPSAFGINVAKDMRGTKKRTLCELQEEENSLLEQRNQLQKEMELRRKAYVALQAENQRLKGQKISFESERVLGKLATAHESSLAPNSSTTFVLPDLNEPFSEY